MKKKLLAVLTAAAMVIGSVPVSASVELTDNGYSSVISKREYAIVPGVTETDIILNNAAGTAQNKGFVMEVDMNDPNLTIIAGYKDYDGSVFGLQSTTDQCIAAEKVLKQTNENAHIVGAVNASFFNMSTGETSGAMVMGGTVYHKTSSGWPYFCVLDDGTAEIRNGNVALGSNVVEAMAGSTILVRNGVNQIGGGGGDYVVDGQPRTAIGIRKDGTVVLFEVDGRQAPSSLGMSFKELAETMIGLGCEIALNLDGGGSSTFITEREGTGERTVKNSPSDGYERTVSGTLMVVSTAAPSGTFDHASLSPNGSVYTPGSSVSFEAYGVDSAGGTAELPEDISWAVADSCADLGTIDAATGVFTGAKDAQGTLTVELISGGKVVGSTSVVLAAPDEISFMNESINLDYEQRSNLGLMAFYKGVEMEIKDGDFVFTIGDSAAGSFDGNTFVAAPNNAARNLSVTTTVTAASAWNAAVKASITVGVGTAPVIVMDGGDADGLNYENIAYVHAAANGGYLEYETHKEDHGNVIVVHYINGDGSSRGGVASAEQVGIDNGQVRFGEKALRLDYDYRNINGIEGACVGFDRDITIEGNPSGIGVWVYAPANTANLWVRIRVKDGTGTIKTLNFGSVPSNDPQADGTYGGINWVGWKYLECDLSDVVGPITLMAGETIRIMHTNGGATGSGYRVCQLDDSGAIVEGPAYVGKTAGSLYLDNLQLVYGTNNADIDNPSISKVEAGASLETAAELASDGSTVIKSNEVTFYSEFSDVQNNNTTGIDLAYVYLDGVNMSDNENCVASLSDGKLILNAMKLANGTHSVKILVRDGYGNESVVTRTFTVAGDDESLTSVNLVADSDEALLGGTYTLKLTSNHVSDVNGVDMVMSLADGFTVNNVAFADSFAGSSYLYDEAADTLTIHAVRSAESSDDEADIASIDINVPADASETAKLTYRVTSGEVAYASEKDASVVNTFATANVSVPIVSAYQLSLDTMLVGSEGGAITVTDANGEKAAGVTICLADGSELGQTDADGVLFTDRLCGKVASFELYAKGELGYSFRIKGQSFAPAAADDASPYYIVLNISEDGSSMQNISWMSSAAYAKKQAVIRYGTDRDNLNQTKEGTSILKSFAGSGVITNNFAVLINGVNLEGLVPASTYYYQVGDGETFSEIKSFTTASDSRKNTTNFFVIGDTQTAVGERDNIDKINTLLDGTAYDFGIQTGDAVETPALYSDWEGFLNVFSTGSLSQTDILHTIGNHEQFADEGATGANAIFNTSGDYYSVEYGNVYVATLSYSQNKEELKAYAKWLVEDASKSDATWKILTLHQPPYYTNTAGENEIINKYIAPACDEAGIDIVFSGHDHTYARTAPMTDHAVNEDGTVYYICGSTGEKSYGVTKNPDFNFAVATQDYSSIYLSVSASQKSLTVTTYDVVNGTPQVFDSYTMNKKTCPNDEHDYLYDMDSNDLICSACGIVENAADLMYSDFVHEKNSGRLVYLVAGTPQIGYQYVNGNHYYFDEQGLGYEGNVDILGETCLFEEGQFVSCSSADVLMAGLCGPAAEFVFYADGTLKIGGTGDMYAFTGFGTVPWIALAAKIRNVVIGKDVTSIGNYSFRGAYRIVSVTFEEPSSLKKIGSYAFTGLKNLESLTLPESLTYIGSNAFYSCTGIKEIWLPDGVETIKNNAFNKSLNVTLSVGEGTYAEMWAMTNGVNYTVRTIPADAVIAEGSCGENSAWTLSADGTLTITGSGAVVTGSTTTSSPWYAYRKQITNAVISKDITSIDAYAFLGCSELAAVTFEEGSALTKIGKYCFSGCSSLTDIVIPEGVYRIDYAVFKNCTSLESVYLPDGINKIDTKAFAGSEQVVVSVAGASYAASRLAELGISYVERAVDTEKILAEGSCGENASWKLTADGLLTLSGSGIVVTGSSSGDAPWYANRADVKKILVGRDITELGAFAFYSCTKAESLEFEEGSALVKIGKYAFGRMESLKEVIIPEGVKKLDYAVLKNCTSLTYVYLPAGITRIDATAFSGDANVTVSVAAGSYAETRLVELGVNTISR